MTEPIRFYSTNGDVPLATDRVGRSLRDYMGEPTRFYSTNHDVPLVTLDKALLQGQAPDRGLFMPQTFPTLPTPELAELTGQSYPDVAHAVLRKYTAGVIDDATLAALIERRPQTLQEFSRISGVGERRLAAYGDDFLEVILTHAV